MSYNVDNIIPINLLLTPSGLGFADFSTAFIFSDDTPVDEYFLEDTYRDYQSLTEIAEDFETTSDTYLIASRWFANIPKPLSISVWLNASGDTSVEAATKADNVAWRYWLFFPKSVTDVDATALLLGTYADSTSHGLAITVSDTDVIDPLADDDIASVLMSAGNRHMHVGYKDPASIALDASQAYSMVQLAAAFNKFRPEGQRTAITGEYQVLPGVIGDDLSTTAYSALKAKNTVFFTQIELQGSTDSSRVINSKSMSSYGEFMDDIVNLDVLKNRLQVNGYNYISGAGTKRPLTPQGYAGLLETLGATCKRFYDNGVLGESAYVDPNTGETQIAKYGYVIFSSPEDVFDLSTAERRAREFPNTSILVILARAGHTALINVNVE